MRKRQSKPYSKELLRKMGEKSHIVSKAQALEQMGMGELAATLWSEAGRREEEIAPLIDALGREREAAAHRISAASCYEKTREWGRAANLYRAALAGPLLDPTRRDVEAMLAHCLAQLAPSRGRKPAAVAL